MGCSHHTSLFGAVGQACERLLGISECGDGAGKSLKVPRLWRSGRLAEQAGVTAIVNASGEVLRGLPSVQACGSCGHQGSC